VLVVFTAYAMLIEAWRRVVLSMGERLAFGPAVRIWFLASLGKYVPGKVWAVAGAAVLAQRVGVDPSVAVAAALVLQALALASGAAAVALTAGDAFQAAGPGLVPVAAVVVLLSFAGMATLASQPVLDRINRLLPSSIPPLRAVPPTRLAVAFAANLLAWAAYGLSLLFLARGLLPGVTLGLLQAIGVFTCSYLVGFLALFAPGGLGPRESVFLLMLAGDIGLKPAAALALASRLLLTGTEVLPAVPLLLRRTAPRPPSIREA
jgi:glycosyltransferase 2 family protein